MAQIQEEVVVIKLSKLIKEGNPSQSLTGEDFESTVESIVQELVGNTVIVEVEKA